MNIPANSYYFLNFATFWAIFFGCATNCLPALLPAALALFVAAFSDALSDFHAASGRYRFLPLLGVLSDVLHFSFVHLDSDVSDLGPLYPPPDFLYF